MYSVKTFSLRFTHLLPLVFSSFCFAQSNFTQYVNPFIGTGGHGHTFPGTVMPFGMVQLSPDTRVDGSWDGCSGYHYSDSIIYGFTHTHLSGTGCSDYGDILLMPTINAAVLQPVYNGDYKVGYASHFSHSTEKASPGYYAVHLDDDDINVELTCTDRVGFHRYKYPKCNMENIVLDLQHRDKVLDSYFHVVDEYTVEGYRRSEAWAQNQVVYFYMEFSQPVKNFGYSVNDTIRYNETFLSTEVRGTNLKAYFGFDPAKSSEVLVKVGISQTGMDGAKKNLDEELPGWDFEKVKANASTAWNNELRKIEVGTSDAEKKKVFYTALYHCMIHPSLANDVDGKYLGRDFKVHQLEAGHDYYTVFSLWDTYRALHPLLTIIDQKRTSDFINSFLLEYQQGGRLPVWELSSNETDCMIGYHSVSVITDAAMKGIKFDYKLALEAMKSSAEAGSPALIAYRERGYISKEDDRESVSQTLEFSYDDWCISQMAKLVGDSSAYKEFIERSQYWKNIFDWNRGFMRPKKNGGWYSPFNPFEVNSNYTEGNAWQYNFAVPQDVDGLIMMMGGKEKMEKKLDSLFSASSLTSGLELPDVSGLIGQYAHGNEPSHHMAYLYDYCGAPWKTQWRVRQIMKMYTDSVNGLIGNEDCGQMSAWYVMSAMGFYEVTPGFPQYAIGSPLFDTVRIHLENQKIFSIATDNNSEKEMFVGYTTLNGSQFDSLLLPHSTIMKGGHLDFVMLYTAKNNFHPGLQFNPSAEIAAHRIPVSPVISSSAASFKDSVKLSVSSYTKSDQIFFSSNSNNDYSKYSRPIVLKNSSSVSAYVNQQSQQKSKVVTATFRKTNKNYKVTYNTAPNPQYTGDGDMTLIDEQSGTNNFHNGQWQGWWGDDMEIIVDLGKETSISKVGGEFLQDQGPWVFFPKEVDVEFSTDGEKFKSESKFMVDEDLFSKDDHVQTATFTVESKPIKARYIKIIAHNYGKLPAWHTSAGENAWLFCDEIFIE